MAAGPQDGVVHFVGPNDPVNLVVAPMLAPGNVAPSRTVHAGQWWLDTSGGPPYRLRRRNENNTAWEPIGAPVLATYVTRTPSTDLPNEQALSQLPTGVLKSTTGTGALSIAGADDLPPHVHPSYVDRALYAAKGSVLIGGGAGTPADLGPGQERQYLRAMPSAPLGAVWSFPPVDVMLGPYFGPNVKANDTTELFVNFFTGGTTTVLGGPGTNDYVLPAAGYVVAGFLNAGQARTAGTMELRLRHNGEVKAWGGLVALDAASPTFDSGLSVPGFAVAAGDRIGAAVVTTGFAPTGVHVRAYVVVRLFVS